MMVRFLAMRSPTKSPLTEPTPIAQASWLPFGRLNLLRNPFGELEFEERVRSAVINFDTWLVDLKSPRIALQFMGDCGRGKTTHMLALLKHFEAGKYVYLPEEKPLPTIPIGSPLFIDEAQRLTWLMRRSAFRRGVPLVLGTHRDLTKSLQRAGYEVQTVEVAEQVTRERLLDVFRQRIELARLGDGELPCVTSADVDWLMHRFGNNVRAMENYLYERFEASRGTNNGKVRVID